MEVSGLRGLGRNRPKLVTAVISLIGYLLVGAAFADLLPLFPELGDETVLLFGDLIAIINTLALSALLVGVYFIRNGRPHRHRLAMLTAFVLIVVFLVLYLWKVGGGFEKSLVIRPGAPLAGYAETIRIAYLIMLAVHIFLSVVAVPVVIHAVVLGLSFEIAELPQTAHPRVGRIAVAAWALSLAMGVLTYILLNHVYAWERMVPVILAGPSVHRWRR